MALSGAGRFTYLFGDLDPQRHGAEALAAAHAYVAASDGYLPREARPRVLQPGILARVPPLDWSGDLIEPLSAVKPSNALEPIDE